jgi:hypothetical protein
MPGIKRMHKSCSLKAIMLKTAIKKHVLVSMLFCLGAVPAVWSFQAPAIPAPKGPQLGPWPMGELKWPDWLEEATKRFEKLKSISQPGAEIEFLQSRTSDLLERARTSRDNFFRFGRYIAAANALMEAIDRFVWLRKIERVPQEQDFWGVGFALPNYYFRVRQVEFFASLSGEKNSEQYVTWAKSFYQQARSAYDAREYQRARLLGDASSFIVFAMESIAQAVVPIPDSPVVK